MKTNNETMEYVLSIVKELETIYKGNCYKCPKCGEVIEWKDNQYTEKEEDSVYKCDCCGETFPEHDMESYGLIDYLCENDLDTEYRIGRDGEYRSASICIGFGGPNVFIDTQNNSAKIYWGGEYAEVPFDEEVGIEIDDFYEQEYESMRG